ncbi:MAG: 2TM domain-containing protein [Thermoplasmatota archaeon]
MESPRILKTLAGGGFPWFVFPLFGWGIGIVAHFVTSFTSHVYVDRMGEREYERLRRNR